MRRNSALELGILLIHQKRFRYWGALQEAWDGPALVAFCDGEYMGALARAETSFEEHGRRDLRCKLGQKRPATCTLLPAARAFAVELSVKRPRMVLV